MPEVVSRDPRTNEVQGVDYARLAALLIEAVKSQQVEIRELKTLCMAWVHWQDRPRSSALPR